MYHDTIQINFRNVYDKNRTLDFEYNFLISKFPENKFAPIKYGELLEKFKEIGFDVKYIKFYDINDDDTLVYCTYNYQENFNVFFIAYKKLLKNVRIGLTFEYGNIISGIFHQNNMNYFSGIFFTEEQKVSGDDSDETIISGKAFKKAMESYRIIDSEGNILAIENAKPENNFEQHFFEKYEVKVHLRKYKLNRLKDLFND